MKAADALDQDVGAIEIEGVIVGALGTLPPVTHTPMAEARSADAPSQRAPSPQR
ncbi:MAG: hypothetical protein ABI895_18230 [Deltaproteobacteria bacterium]